MSSGSYNQAYVQCPYYKRDDGRRRIICEGLVEAGNISLFYTRKDDYDRQMRTFCCKYYQRCEIYQALRSIYDDERAGD